MENVLPGCFEVRSSIMQLCSYVLHIKVSSKAVLSNVFCWVVAAGTSHKHFVKRFTVCNEAFFLFSFSCFLQI